MWNKWPICNTASGCILCLENEGGRRKEEVQKVRCLIIWTILRSWLWPYYGEFSIPQWPLTLPVIKLFPWLDGMWPYYPLIASSVCMIFQKCTLFFPCCPFEYFHWDVWCHYSAVVLQILKLHLLYNLTPIVREGLYERTFIRAHTQSQCCSNDVYIFTKQDGSIQPILDCTICVPNRHH